MVTDDEEDEDQEEQPEEADKEAAVNKNFYENSV